MAKIKIRNMIEQLPTQDTPSTREIPIPARASNVRITPPSQASLFRKTVPGSILTKDNIVPLPQLQVFFSAKGGSGSSFLAAAYASAAAVLTHSRVLLVDMDLKTGGIEAYTGIEPTRSIVDLKPVLAELNDTHIASVVHTERAAGIHILASPADPELANAFEPWQITVLLQHLKKMYDVIVIDTASELAAQNIPLFAAADVIHYIMLPDTPSLRRYKLAESWLQSHGISLRKIAVLLNRVGKANEIQLRDLRQIPALNIEGIIRSDFAAIQSDINLGQPIMRHYQARKQPMIIKDLIALIKTQTAQAVF